MNSRKTFEHWKLIKIPRVNLLADAVVVAVRDRVNSGESSRRDSKRRRLEGLKSYLDSSTKT